MLTLPGQSLSVDNPTPLLLDALNSQQDAARCIHQVPHHCQYRSKGFAIMVHSYPRGDAQREQQHAIGVCKSPSDRRFLRAVQGLWSAGEEASRKHLLSKITSSLVEARVLSRSGVQVESVHLTPDIKTRVFPAGNELDCHIWGP